MEQSGESYRNAKRPETSNRRNEKKPKSAEKAIWEMKKKSLGDIIIW